MDGAGGDANDTDKVSTDKARRGLERAEVGDVTGARRVDEAQTTDPEGADAAEQEASDGPEGRGLSR